VAGRVKVSFRMDPIVLQVVDEIARQAGATRSHVLNFVVQKALGEDVLPRAIMKTSYGVHKAAWDQIEVAIHRIRQDLKSEGGF